MRRCISLFSALSLLLLGGCSGESDPTGPAACPADRVVGGVCVGVPTDALCEDATCPMASCSSSVVVASDAELGAALGGASSGTCVLLTPGAYTEAVLPAGVHLLGKGADHVTVGRVDMTAGQGGTLRGVTVGSGGVSIGATGATVDSVRVSGSTGSGITLGSGAEATVTHSEVTGSARYAISAFDVAALTVEASLLEGATGPGLWAQCAEGCACAARPSVDIRDTVIRDTKRVGLSLVGVTATLTNVEVRDNSVDSGFMPAGGVAISACSEVAGAGVRVIDNTDFGMLIDGSTVRFAPDGAASALDIEGNLRGLWIQRIGVEAVQSVELRGLTLLENTGVAVGISGDSLDVSLTDTVIRDTFSVVLPVEIAGVPAGSEQVGDGVNWLDASQVTVSGLTIAASARASFLIDGEVADGSSLDTVTLEGGDEAFGIYQQSLPAGGRQPAVGAAVPDITTSVEPTWPIGERLGIPPEI